MAAAGAGADHAQGGGGGEGGEAGAGGEAESSRARQRGEDPRVGGVAIPRHAQPARGRGAKRRADAASSSRWLASLPRRRRRAAGRRNVGQVGLACLAWPRQSGTPGGRARGGRHESGREAALDGGRARRWVRPPERSRASGQRAGAAEFGGSPAAGDTLAPGEERTGAGAPRARR